MAKQLNVSLNIVANTEQAKREMKALSDQLNKIGNTNFMDKGAGKEFVDSINRAKQSAAELQIALRSAFNESTGKIDFTKFESSLKRSSKTLEMYGKELAALGPEGQQAFLKITQAVAQSEVPIIRMSNLLKQLGTTLANTARWQISSSVLHGFMGAVQSAYGYAQDLNRSLNDIRIVTGYSANEMARFAETANKAAQSLSTTTTAYTDAALIFYQQGLSDEQVKARTDATIKMANVTGENAEHVSSYMTAIWNNFDDGSKSLEYYADVMTKLGAATAASSEEIAEGMEKFAAVGNTVGLSYEYAAAAVTTVIDKTRQSADIVGTSFKTIFARLEGLQLGETLEDGTDLNKYSKALASVGVDIKDQNGELKQMDQILDEMGAKWETLSKDQQVALAQTVGGVRQYTQLIALMENFDAFQKNVQLGLDSEGTLQEQQEIYAQSWEASAKRVRAAWEALYDDLLHDSFFIKLNNWLVDALQTIDKLVDSLGGVQGVLLTIAPIFTKIFGEQMLHAAAEGIRAINYSLLGGQERAEKRRQTMVEQSQQQTAAYLKDHPDEKRKFDRAVLLTSLTANNENLTEEQKELLNVISRQYDAQEAELALLKEKLKLEEKIVEQKRKEFEKSGYVEGLGAGSKKSINTPMSNRQATMQWGTMGVDELQDTAIGEDGKPVVVRTAETNRTLKDFQNQFRDNSEQLNASREQGGLGTRTYNKVKSILDKEIDKITDDELKELQKVAEQASSLDGDMAQKFNKTVKEVVAKAFRIETNKYKTAYNNAKEEVLNNLTSTFSKGLTENSSYEDYNKAIAAQKAQLLSDRDTFKSQLDAAIKSKNKNAEESSAKVLATINLNLENLEEASKQLKGAFEDLETQTDKVEKAQAKQVEKIEENLLDTTNSKTQPQLQGRINEINENADKFNEQLPQMAHEMEDANKAANKYKDSLTGIGQGALSMAGGTAAAVAELKILHEAFKGNIGMGQALLSTIMSMSYALPQLATGFSSASKGLQILTGSAKAANWTLGVTATVIATTIIAYNAYTAHMEKKRKEYNEGVRKDLEKLQKDFEKTSEEIGETKNVLELSGALEEMRLKYQNLNATKEEYNDLIVETAKNLNIENADTYAAAGAQSYLAEQIERTNKAARDSAREQAGRQQKNISNQILTAANINTKGEDYAEFTNNQLFIDTANGKAGVLDKLTIEALEDSVEGIDTYITQVNNGFATTGQALDVNKMATEAPAVLASLLEMMPEIARDPEQYGAVAQAFEEIMDEVGEDLPQYIEQLHQADEIMTQSDIQDFLDRQSITNTLDYSELQKQYNDVIANAKLGELDDETKKAYENAIKSRFVAIDGEIGANFLLLQQASDDLHFDLSKVIDSGNVENAIELLKTNYSAFAAAILLNKDDIAGAMDEINKALASIDTTTFIENINELVKAIDSLKYGDIKESTEWIEMFGQEVYDEMVAAGELVQTATGDVLTVDPNQLQQRLQNRTYGMNQEEANAYYDSLIQELQKGLVETENKSVGNILQQLGLSDLATGKYQEQFNLSADRLSGTNDLADIFNDDNISKEEKDILKSILDGTINDAINDTVAGLEAEKTAYEQFAFTAETSLEDIKTQWTDYGTLVNRTANYTRAALIRSAQEYGLNADEVANYSDWLQQNSEDLQDNAESADYVALAQYRLEIGLKDLNSNFDSYAQTLQEATVGSTEYVKAMNSIEEDLQHVFNTEEEIDDSFITSHLEDIEKAAQGDLEAITDLQLAFALASTDAEGAFAKAGQDLAEFQNEIDEFDKWNEIEIGASIDTAPMLNDWFNAMNKMVAEQQMSAEDMQRIWNSLGFELEPEHGKQMWILPSGALVDSLQGMPASVVDQMGIVSVVTGFKGANYTGTNRAASSVKKSTGSGGGGGKSSQKEQKEEEERYYVVSRLLKDQQDQLDRLDKAKNRAYGKAHLDLINQEAAALEREKEINDQYLKEIEGYLASDRAKVAGMGAQFDENGIITNYEQLLKQYVDQYNAAVTSGDEAAIEMYEKQLEDFKNFAAKYDETRNLWIQKQDEITEELRAIYDKELEGIQYTLQVKVELNDDSLKVLQYQLQHLQDIPFSTAEQLVNKNQQVQLAMNRGNYYRTAAESIIGGHGKNVTIDQVAGMSDEELANLGYTADEIAELRSDIEGMLSSGNTVSDLAKQIVSGPLEAFKEWNAEFEYQNQIIAHNSKLLQSYINIGKLGYSNIPGMNDDFISGLMRNSFDTGVASTQALKEELEAKKKAYNDYYESVKNMMDDEVAGKQIRENLREMQKDIQTAEENVLASIESTMQQAQAIFEDSLEKAKKTFQQATATDDWSMTLFERQKEMDDMYLDDYEKIYEFSKLTRDVNNSINNTQTIRDRERLLEVTEEIAQLEREGAEVSQYQVDALRAKYELRLAEIALEDAQNAKSTVRMQRDNEGNWSYVYTAEQDKVDEARQNYEDKLYEYQKLNSDFIKEQQTNFLNMEKKYQEEVEKIAKDAFLSEDEKRQRIQETTEYYEQLGYNMNDQLLIAIGKNKELYDKDWKWYHDNFDYKISAEKDYITTFENTYLGPLGDLYENFKDAMVGEEGYVTLVDEAIKQFGEDQRLAMQAGGITDYINQVKGAADGAMQSTSEAASQVHTDADNMVTDIGNVINKMKELYGLNASNFVTQMGEAAGAVTQFIEKWSKVNNTGLPNPSSPPSSGGVDSQTPYASNANGSGGKDGSQGDTPAPASSGSSPIQSALDMGKRVMDNILERFDPTKLSANSLYKRFQDLKRAGAILPEFALDYMTAIEEARDFNARMDIFKKFMSAYGDKKGIMSSLKQQGYKFDTFDTGGYTGSWGTSGRLALLHQKELVLNAQDTENMLKMTEYVRDLAQMVDLRAAADSMARVDGMGSAMTAAQAIEQNVRIEASFPNVTSSSEIEEAFNNLVNRAAQYASRTKY